VEFVKDNIALVETSTQAYARWLRENSLSQLAARLEEKVYSANASALNQLNFSPEPKTNRLYFNQLITRVLDSLASEKPLQWLTERSELWRGSKNPHTQPQELTADTIALFFSQLKSTLIAQLTEFTSDTHLALTIVGNLEDIFGKGLALSLKSYHRIKDKSQENRQGLLETVLHNINVGIVVLDLEYRYLEWNPTMERLLGLSRNEVLGKRISEVFGQEAEDNFRVKSAPVLQGKLIVEEAVPFVNKEGNSTRSIIPLVSNNQPENIIGLILLIQETTELLAQKEALKTNLEEFKKSQKQLKRTVKQLEEAQALAHIGNWEFNIKKNKVSWSKELYRIFGISSGEDRPTFNTYFEYVHPEDLKYTRRLFTESIKKQQSFILEHRICCPNGQIRWLLSQGQIIKNKKGNPILLRGTALDITRQKAAEFKAQEEQHFIKSITTTTPDIITVFDLNQKEIIYANHDLYMAFGYTGEALDNLKALTGPQQIAQVVHPEDLLKVYKFLERFRTYKGQGHREIEYRVNSASGKQLWILGRYTPFRRTPEGEVTQVIGILQNVSVQKRNAEALKISEARLRKYNLKLESEVTRRTKELQLKNQELTRINLDLDNFVYTASHDLKVPIANLEGLLTLLQKKLLKGLSEREQDLLGMVYTSINRLKKTIGDLTDVARIQKELEEEEFEEVNFEEVLADVLPDMQKIIDESNAKVFVSSELETITFNSKNLKSILHNLISNSIKYRHPKRKPKIYINLQPASPRFNLLQVRDNGCGIPQKQLPKIFTLFKRLNKDIEGSGMGLYIVKRIVENSGGYLDVTSQPDKGTTFNLYLSNQHDTV
jgi:PAS domain S-box-containing protein